MSKSVEVVISGRSIYDEKGGRVAQMLKWAKESCNSYITVDAIPIGRVEDPGGADYDIKYTFYFGQESDATFFRLKWT